jgi:hypothetical protein
MRTLLVLPFVSLIALSAQAQTPAEPHHRMTQEQHFEQANTTHDGHLTLPQAKAAYATIARHFREIDSSGKGYVTEDDIKAWHAQQRAARQAAKTAAADPLRPRQAMHRVVTGQPAPAPAEAAQ